MEGELLYLRILSVQISVTMRIPCDNIKVCVIKCMRNKRHSKQQENVCRARETKKIWRYNNSYPCVMAKWCDGQITLLISMGVTHIWCKICTLTSGISLMSPFKGELYP